MTKLKVECMFYEAFLLYRFLCNLSVGCAVEL